MTVEAVCRLFGIPGPCDSCRVLSGGLINTTYLASFGGTDYVVQKINSLVFKNPEQIMSNVRLVTGHIRKKLLAAGEDADRMVLRFLETAEGANYFIDEEGAFWRCYPFIPRSVAYNATDDPVILENAGRAFGLFQKNLLDFDAASLYETIPGFHNTPKRLDTLFADEEKDPCGRAASAKAELDYIRANRERAGSLYAMAEKGELPFRVTHNDTKSNNVLFDEADGSALAVIDLDTVMPGLIMYDFGDAVRFAANTAAEDEPDLSLVSLSLDKYTAFARGFVGALGEHITPKELDNMALGVYAITVELASRFLDDYLTGDTYFACGRPGHNLDRTRCQLALAKDIDVHLAEMQEIAADIWRESLK